MIAMSTAVEERRAEDPPAQTEVAYRHAKERAQALQGLYIHILIYAVINAGLFVINAVTRGEGGYWWFFWPLLAWGLGLAVHVVAVFVPFFSPEWVGRRAHRMVEKQQDGR
jgi:hypothetical protein